MQLQSGHCSSYDLAALLELVSQNVMPYSAQLDHCQKWSLELLMHWLAMCGEGGAGGKDAVDPAAVVHTGDSALCF